MVYVDPGRPVDATTLERMNQVIVHRGPDSGGSRVHGNAGIAMRRLSIIDVSGGRQPISNENGDVWIVFNGEIYNFQELRADLQQRGHRFRTNSDTETIVHAYEEYGTDCVQHLRGMFAFAIRDERRDSLFLARDRLGQKPLYYAQHDGALIFGSEIKCLLEYPGFPRDTDFEAIHHYLSLQYVPDPWSAFRAVRKLPPACTLEFSAGKILTRRYWDLAYEPKAYRKSAKAYAEAKEHTREVLREAVRIRMISEVPVGAHLSGGIDSSIIVGLMSELGPVKTFSIRFGEAGFDESSYARVVAEKFGTDHHEFQVDAGPQADMIPQLIDSFDEPFADPAAVPTFFLSKLTRRHVTVALNGDGGDEAFAGYQRLYADAVANLYGFVPGVLRHGVIGRFLNLLRVNPAAASERDYASALKTLGRAADFHSSASTMRWGQYPNAAEKHRLYRDGVFVEERHRETERILRKYYDEALAKTRLDRTLYTDLHSYLPGALLTKVDRMTMANSLEARSPFLDHVLMETAAQLPCAWKIRGTTTKIFLRDLFPELMPTEIARRGKQGFGVPLALWFRGPLYEYARDVLLGRDAKILNWFHREPLEALLERNRAGHQDLGRTIWLYVMLEAWLQRYG